MTLDDLARAADAAIAAAAVKDAAPATLAARDAAVEAYAAAWRKQAADLTTDTTPELLKGARPR